LTPTTFGGVTVDGCHQCGGVWFDRGELTRLAQGDLSQLAAIDGAFEGAPSPGTPSSAAGGPCPVCATRLQRFEPPQTPGLQLVGCPSGHGTWLGEDDFERIIQRVEQWHGAQGAGSPGAAPARQRLREIAHLLLSGPCPKCRQPNANASPVCWACGAFLQTTQARFCCPTCGQDLARLVYEGTLLNNCDNCGGLWLDRGELGALIQLAREKLQRLRTQLEPPNPATLSGDAAGAVCPTCRDEMRYHEYGLGSGVFIHQCEGCRGLWMDPAGLIGIQKFAMANETFLASERGQSSS
jgi:Zn-finger nucleic acid-binding protein